MLAGADILLHPSRYEPCGLGPIYAMHYGTLPIVRRTGGTADSVVDVVEQTVLSDTATGFAFERPSADAPRADQPPVAEAGPAVYPVAARRSARAGR
jgi:starch synthase